MCEGQQVRLFKKHRNFRWVNTDILIVRTMSALPLALRAPCKNVSPECGLRDIMDRNSASNASVGISEHSPCDIDS